MGSGSEKSADFAYCERIGWDEAMDDFLLRLASVKETKTQEYYQSRLRILVRWAQAENLTLQEFRGRHLARYLEWRRNQPVHPSKPQSRISDRTRRHDASCARVFFRFLAREEIIPSNPMVDYELPKPPKTLGKCPSHEDIILLLTSIRHRWSIQNNPPIKNIPPARRRFFEARNYAIIAGCIDSACRISEMLNLTMDDYQSGQLQAIFRNTKTDQDRTVPITARWIELVKEYLKHRPKSCPSNTLFVNEYGESVDPGAFSHLFRDHMKWARAQKAFENMSHFTLHGLRHYAITCLSEISLTAAQAIAGHASLATTQLYIHTTSQHIQATHAQAKMLPDILVNKRSVRQAARKVRKSLI
jgi:site-specific recombinase XerD